MFFIPKTNVVESDEGFSVEVTGRLSLAYKEGEKCVIIDSEILAVGYGIAIYKDSIKYWLDSGSEITEPERNKIIDNIRRAIEFRRQPLEVI